MELDLKTFVPKYSDSEIFLCIKEILNRNNLRFRDEEIQDFSKVLMIADIINNISDLNLFNNTLDLINSSFIKNKTYEDKIQYIESVTEKLFTNGFENFVTVKSFFLQSYWKYDILKTMKGKEDKIMLEELIITKDFKKGILYSNIDEVEKVFFNSLSYSVYSKSNEDDLNDSIKYLNKNGFIYGDDNSKTIKLLKHLRDELSYSGVLTTKETKNQYNHIFANNGFELFNYILKNFIADKGQRGRYADVSFYYWKMYDNKPKYIHQRPEVFKNWFCERYSDSFEKIRTKTDTTNRNRVRNFTTALDWFKQTD